MPGSCVPLLLSFPATGGESSASVWAPNRRTFMLPCSLPGLPGPVYFSSRAAGLNGQKLCPPAPLRQHKRPFSTGAPELLGCRGGEAGMAHKDWIVCRLQASRTRANRQAGANLSPTGQPWGRGAGSGACLTSRVSSGVNRKRSAMYKRGWWWRRGQPQCSPMASSCPAHL